MEAVDREGLRVGNTSKKDLSVENEGRNPQKTHSQEKLGKRFHTTHKESVAF